MNQKLKQAIKYIFFWLLGLGLLYFAFKDQDLSEVQAKMKEADYSWAVLILLISVLNHISRAMRWQLLMKPLGYHPQLKNSFMTLMFGYLVNYAVPRLGEVSRCAALNKAEGIPFKPLLGTVITERAIDIICLALVTLLAVVLESENLYAIYVAEIEATVMIPLTNYLLAHQWILIGLICFGLGGIALIWLTRRQWVQWNFVQKIWKFTHQIWEGMIAIAKMKNYGQFLLHTLFIWFGYFLMTYLWFFSFEETAVLSPRTGLVLMVLGSFSRSLPIQGGGMGAYHYIFTQGLLLYGIAEVYGGTIAVLNHGTQTAFHLVVGGLCTLILAYKR